MALKQAFHTAQGSKEANVVPAASYNKYRFETLLEISLISSQNAQASHGSKADTNVASVPTTGQHCRLSPRFASHLTIQWPVIPGHCYLECSP